MQIEIVEEPMERLAEHLGIPIAFRVESVLDVQAVDGGLGGLRLRERPVEIPYVKDYDTNEDPTRWPHLFDLSRWGLLAARSGGRRIGGALLAWDTPGVEMLEGRADLLVLWDLRVAPEARSQGVGAALFRHAEVWARARGCRQLKVETQNVNVPACRFYARQGCVLGAIRCHAYPELPHEAQLLWYKQLGE